MAPENRDVHEELHAPPRRRRSAGSRPTTRARRSSVSSGRRSLPPMAQALLDSTTLPDFGGELLQDGDPGYEDARRVFNAAIDRRPALIARCTGVADVIAALALRARARAATSRVRGGGHSVAGHAVVDGGLMIDLRPMNRVRVDPERRTAWCGGGANWGELDRETQAFGLAVTGRADGRHRRRRADARRRQRLARAQVRLHGRQPDLGRGGHRGRAAGRGERGAQPRPVLGAQGRRRQLRRRHRLRVPAARGRAARLRRDAVLPDRRGRRPAEGLPRLHGGRARRDLRRRGDPVRPARGVRARAGPRQAGAGGDRVLRGPGRGGRARVRAAARVGPALEMLGADAVRGGAGADRAGQPARAPPLLEGGPPRRARRTRRSRPSSRAHPT